MKYLDEYRDADLTRKLLVDIQKIITRPWTLMEVCGGQTHSILKSGLDQMVPAEINLVQTFASQAVSSSSAAANRRCSMPVARNSQAGSAPTMAASSALSTTREGR